MIKKQIHGNIEEAFKLKKQAEQAFSDYDAYNRIYNIQKVPEYFLYSIWPFMDAGINHAQNKKQGGKMNILEFLKNGSGIYIKKENKGKYFKSINKYVNV